MGKKLCSDCCNFKKIYTTEIFGREIPAVDCTMYPNRIFTAKDIEKSGHCPYFNKNMSNEKICGNCKYYLGGGDWGLSCMKNYYRLPQYDSKTCSDFEPKDGAFINE